MAILREIWNRVAYLRRRRSLDNDLEQELQFHLETRADELVQSGMARADALAQARREFGSVARLQEDSRAAWQLRWLEDFMSDVRYALRGLRRNPAFAVVAVSCLALGIGVNSTIFSLAMEVMFSHPSVRDPQSVVNVQIGGSDSTPVAVWRFLHDQGGFNEVAGIMEMDEANWRLGDETHHLYTARVTDNFFDTMGVPILIGRPIQKGERNSAVVSYRFWQRWFSGDGTAVGKTLLLDGNQFTITGILPSDHRSMVGLGISPDVYLPVQTEKEQVSLYVSIPEGLNRAAVKARLAPLCRELDRIMPRPRNTWQQSIKISGVMGLERLESWGLLSVAGFFAVLMVVVGLVLLIACTNVASLLLARASSRNQELAVRTSLGATRARIVRQLIAESSLLALLGVTGGLILNLLLTKIMNNISLPIPLAIRLSIQPDWRLLGYLMVLAVLCTLLAGLMPALTATRGAMQSILKQDQGQVRGALWSMRNALIVGQLAISSLLLLTGALFTRNMMKSATTDLGFNVDHTLWTYMRLVPGKYTTTAQIIQLTDSTLDEIRRLPGVDAASAVRVVPMHDVSHFDGDWDIHTDLSAQTASLINKFDQNWVSADYFKTMDIPITQGRAFLPSERQGTPEVGILNEEMARLAFGNQSPIGHTVTIAALDKHPILIVGVVRNSKYWRLGEGNMPALYKAYSQANFPKLPTDIHFMVRAAQPHLLIQPLNYAISARDQTAFVETQTMRSALSFALLPSRIGAVITGSVGLLGVSLAAIGLYGLLLYSISRRTKEIGLRMALGASRSDVIRMVMRESLMLCVCGLTIGLGLAAFATRPLATFLVPELSPRDPLSFILVALVMSAIAVAATLPPLLHALRIDPMIALRHE
jgi:predicted permease